jgi:hypothetical protein
MFSMPTDDVSDEKEGHHRYSTISPNLSDVGAQSPSNEHIDRLAGILLTYNFYEEQLGECVCMRSPHSCRKTIHVFALF